jgi:hypothetical protein
MTRRHWLLSLPGGVRAFSQRKPSIQTGVVARADGAAFALNAIPCVTATPGGNLIAVWCARAADPKSKLRVVGVRSSDGGLTWTPPFALIDNAGKSDADPSIVIDGKRIVVLCSTLTVPGKILATETWVTASDDEGKSWTQPIQASQPHKYTDGKVHVGHKLKDGRLAVGYSWDVFCEKGLSPATEGEMELRAGLMFSSDGGRHWVAGGDMSAHPAKLTPHAVNGVDEPATVILENGEVYALLRTATDHLWESRSRDAGASWSAPVPSPLVGHNAPAALWRLRDSGDVVVAWNESPLNRWPLVAAISRDGCRTWSRSKVIVDTGGQQVSYPSVTQDRDGAIVAVWQQDLPGRKGREIRMARFDREWLLE